MFLERGIARIWTNSHNPAALNSRSLVERFHRTCAVLADELSLSMLISHRVWKEPFHADFQ